MIDKINLKNTVIGGDHVFIIAEIGQNHNGDINIAKKLIDVSKEAGVDAVKFQKRDLDTELTKEEWNRPYTGPNSFGRTYGEHRKFLELSEEQLIELKLYAEERGLLFFSSATGPDSADLLDKLGVELFKIASRDLTNLPLIEHIAKKRKPMILSTGMSTFEDIENALNIVTKYTDKVVLLQCTSEYPTPYEDVNLNAMLEIKKRFNTIVGFSDHTIGIMVPIAAVALGAKVIEKHITLARYMKGSDHAGALEPQGLKKLVRDIRNLEKSFGNGFKQVLDGEMNSKTKLARSIVAKLKIEKNKLITIEDLIMKSPGNGLPAKYIKDIVGKRAKKDIEEDEIVKLEDFY